MVLRGKINLVAGISGLGTGVRLYGKGAGI